MNIKYVSDELLNVLSSKDHCPMKDMVLLMTTSWGVADAERYQPQRYIEVIATSNKAWESMVSHSPDMEVGIVCHYGFEHGMLIWFVNCYLAVTWSWTGIVPHLFLSSFFFLLSSSSSSSSSSGNRALAATSYIGFWPYLVRMTTRMFVICQVNLTPIWPLTLTIWRKTENIWKCFFCYKLNATII